MANVQLWLKPEIFFHGVVCAHQKLNFSYLKKVLAYAKSKGSEGGYPYLNWTIWKHMAVNKMLLSEDLAWTYFNLFYILTEKDRSHWLQLSEDQQMSIEFGTENSYKDKMKVPTIEFVIFLYIQQANKITLRKSMLGEDWPGINSKLNIKANLESGTKLSDDSKYLEFFSGRISHLFDILLDLKTSSDDKHISLEVIRALSSFVVGRLDHNSNVQKLQEISRKDCCHLKNGYDKNTRSFIKCKFISWFTGSLVHNPFNLRSCLANGYRLKWTLNSDEITPNKPSRKQRICYNINKGVNSCKTVVFTYVIDQTIAKESNVLWKSHVMIQKCQKTFFYLLSPLKYVSIEKCVDCTFVLGPIGTSLKVVDCKNITIIAPCRSSIIYSSSAVNLFLSSPNQPIIVLDNKSGANNNTPVKLGPYNTFYSKLGSHLIEVGLSISPETNQWNKPVIINIDLKQSNVRSNVSVLENLSFLNNDLNYIIIPTTEFYLFVIPFKCKLSKNVYETTEIPWKLPVEYQNVVNEKKQITERWKAAFKGSSLTKEQSRMFQKVVEERFIEWVTETGNIKQLRALGLKA